METYCILLIKMKVRNLSYGKKKSCSFEQLSNQYGFNYASAPFSNGTTETNERLSFFLRNSTKPSVNANNV